MMDDMSELAPRSVGDWRSPAIKQPITAHRYISPDYMAQEWEQVWSKTWLIAALERDVAEPGEYVVFNLGRESILVSCDDDGDIGAFYNVCQHRGARVVVDDRGRTQNFVCPYHGWTYDNAGALTVVPAKKQFAGRVDCDSLKPVRCETWAGLVWVCMDSDTPPLAEYLGPLVDLIEPFRIDDMTLITDQTVSLDCNWKAVYDNFGELYHVEHIHPQHALTFDCPRAELGLYRHGHTGVFIEGFTVNTKRGVPEEPTEPMAAQMRLFGLNPDDYRGRVLDVRKAIQQARREAGPGLGYDYDLLTDEQLSDINQFNFFPNAMATIQPDDMIIMRARPHPTDPNLCWWDKFTFMMRPEAGDAAARQHDGFGRPVRPEEHIGTDDRPCHDEFTHDQVLSGEKTLTITIDQDIRLIRDVQAGMHSRGFDAALLSDEEERITHHHHWLDHYMGQPAHE
jgi:phenylpropionate dioxygenase-like ring-hydroxylating dioxygenase large terminal subunit